MEAKNFGKQKYDFFCKSTQKKVYLYNPDQNISIQIIIKSI